MKIVWITNIPIGSMAKELSTNAGLWMDVLLEELKDYPDMSFVVATSWNVPDVEKKEIDRVTYYLVPGGPAGVYKRDLTIATREWDKLFENEQPDILQVWGSENNHVIPALEAAKNRNIPRVVYIQGLLKSISRHADGHVLFCKKLRYTTLRDVYRKQLWIRQRKWFEKRAKTEETILRLADGVIIENNWAEQFCKSENREIIIYKIPLSINKEFSRTAWSFDRMIPHTIVCNASSYAYKGLHNLIEALKIVKERFPDVKLYVPGKNLKIGKGLRRQKAPGYWLYINDLIRKYDLEDNVVFTGQISQEELAKLLSKTNVFVLCSAIENHSSSLKEAMSVGTPSVASMVGGVAEYFLPNKCGFLYRYEETECLSGYIMTLFEDEALCKSFSEYEKRAVNKISGEQIGELVIKMYQDLKERYR